MILTRSQQRTSEDIHRVINKTRNDQNLTCAIVLDSIHKWKHETNDAILKVIRDNHTTKEKHSGIILALTEYGKNNQTIDTEVLNALMHKINSPLHDDVRGDYETIVRSTLELLRGNMQFESIFDWYKSRITFNKENTITKNYTEPYLNIIDYYLKKKPLIKKELELELLQWAKDLETEILSKRKPEHRLPKHIQDLMLNMYSKIIYSLGRRLSPKCLILRSRLFLRTIIIKSISNIPRYALVNTACTAIAAAFGSFYIINGINASTLFGGAFAVCALVFFGFFSWYYKEPLGKE